jgi:hypothetical protein
VPRHQDAADDVNFLGKKVGLSLSKFGQKVKDEFTVHQRSTTAGTLAANTAAAERSDARAGGLPDEPDGLRDLIKARRGHLLRFFTHQGVKGSLCRLLTQRAHALLLAAGVCGVQCVLDPAGRHAALVCRGTRAAHAHS